MQSVEKREKSFFYFAKEQQPFRDISERLFFCLLPAKGRLLGVVEIYII
jgi:hypothetical protein